MKVMHRNHILPLGQEVRLGTNHVPKSACSPRAMRQRKAKEKNRTNTQNSDPTADEPQRDHFSSDSESEFGYYLEDMNMPETSEQCAQEVSPVESDDTLVITTEPQVIESAVDLPVLAEEDGEVVSEAVENQECVSEGMPTGQLLVESLDVPCVVRKSEREREPAERFYL